MLQPIRDAWPASAGWASSDAREARSRPTFDLRQAVAHRLQKTAVAKVALPDELGPVIVAGSSDAVFVCPCFEEPGNTVWKLDLATQELTAAMNVPDAYWIVYDAETLWSGSRTKAVITRIKITE